MSKTMRIYTYQWGADTRTFRMLPVDVLCPFNEVVFDPVQKILAILSKEKKDTLKMAPRLNDAGDPELAKGRRMTNNVPYKEQRLTVEVYYEYQMDDLDEIKAFVKEFAANFDEIDLEPIYAYTKVKEEAKEETEA